MELGFLSDSTFWPEFIFTLIIGDLILTIVGVLIAGRLHEYWRGKRHGGWKVRIVDHDEVKGEFPVSAEKQIEIQDDTAERDVFLKGRTSVHAWLNTDVGNLLSIDKENRLYTIDLAANTKKEAPPPLRITVKQGDKQVEWLSLDRNNVVLDLDVLLSTQSDTNETESPTE